MSTVGCRKENINSSKLTRRTKKIIDFSRVGGLSHHLKLLREIIIFPLIYPDLYAHFNIKAPRGVLFYGPPGTGKTLVAGALAVELNKEGLGKVSFYQRKGADVLDKWVGESERKLRELFEKAARTRPSVIFFDELDGLAPERSQKNDQIHCSVVATLLALMDGLDTMPGVIVIGATNRIDSIDPALRRPGRFDKELYFPLPSMSARLEIFQVLIKSWKHEICPEFLTYLAELTAGFSGSDLNALCAETILCCLKRIHPDLQNLGTIKKIKIEPQTLQVKECDFLNAKLNIISSAQRVGNRMRKLSPFIKPLLSRQLMDILKKLHLLWPHFTQADAKFLTGLERYAARLLLMGSNMQGLNTHIIPALLQALEHLPSLLLDTPDLLDKMSSIRNTKKNLPSILILSRVDEWWDLLDISTQLGISSELEDLHAGLPILLIATCNNELPLMLARYFYSNSSLVVNIEDPITPEREEFFAPLFFGDNISVLHILNKKYNNSVKDTKKENVKKFENNTEKSKQKIECKTKGRTNEVDTRGIKRKTSIEDEIPEKRKKNTNCASSILLIEEKHSGCPLSTDVISTNLQIKYSDDVYGDAKQSCDNMNCTYCIEECHVSKKNNFTTILTQLVKRNSKHVVPNLSRAHAKDNLQKGCNKVDSKFKFNFGSKTHCFRAYGDSPDMGHVKIFKLWKRVAHHTSDNLPVGLLELLYDSIIACINIHKDNFDLLIMSLEKNINNFEKTYKSF